MTAAAGLESQLDELRQTVAALQAAANLQPRVSLVPAESAPYLGQAVNMILTVLNRAGSTPLANVPVTLIASWGVLRGEDDLIEGAGISGVTGVDGRVRVTLRPRVSLDTNEDQDALEAMLALLDPAAAAPNAALAAFQTLAQQYRWEPNSGYRAAVDAYFNDFGQQILRGTTPRDYMTAWTLIPATVIAHVAETAGNTAAAATVTVGLRDWLGPWYQVFEEHATSKIQLGGDFTFVKQQASTPSGLIAGVFARTGNAVDAEFGEVGKKVARQIAQRAIGDFLNTGISDLSSDMRQAVGPILETGSRVLASAGGSVVSALGQTHAVAVTTAGRVATKVERTDFDSALTLKANAADVAAVRSTLATKADLTAFTTFQTQTNSAIATKADAADLKKLQTTLGLKADASAFTTFQTQTAEALRSKVDATAVNSLVSRIGVLENRIR